MKSWKSTHKIVGHGVAVLLAFLLYQSTWGQASFTNQVLSLDGSSGYVSVADSPGLDLSSGDFSISAWVWLSQWDSLNTVIMAKREGSGQGGWMFYVGGLQQGQEAKKAAFIVPSGASPRIVGTTDITINAWHHIAIVFHTSTLSAELYVDGALDGTNTLPQPLPTNQPLLIGSDTLAARYFLNGKIDEIRVWNKTLTQLEVAGSRFCRLTGAETNLVAYWNFDGGTLFDSSGHGR